VLVDARKELLRALRCEVCAYRSDQDADLLDVLRDLRFAGASSRLPGGDRGKPHLQFLQVVEQRRVDPIAATELGFEIAYAGLAPGAIFVEFLERAGLQHVVRLRARDRLFAERRGANDGTARAKMYPPRYSSRSGDPARHRFLDIP
jgi:hypothetical protein